MAAVKLFSEPLGCTMDRCDFIVKACDAAGACKTNRFTTPWCESIMAPTVMNPAAPSSNFWFYTWLAVCMIVGCLLQRPFARAMDSLAEFLEPHAETRQRLWPLYTTLVLPFAVYGAVVFCAVVVPLVMIEEELGLRPYVDAVLRVLENTAALLRRGVIGTFNIIGGLILGICEVILIFLELCVGLVFLCSFTLADPFLWVFFDPSPEERCIFCRLFTLATWVIISSGLAAIMSEFVSEVCALLGYLFPILDRFLEAGLEFTNRRLVMTLMVMFVLRFVDFYWDLLLLMSDDLHDDDILDGGLGDEMDAEEDDGPDDAQENQPENQADRGLDDGLNDDILWRFLVEGMSYLFPLDYFLCGLEALQQYMGQENGQENGQDDPEEDDEGIWDDGQESGQEEDEDDGPDDIQNDGWVQVPRPFPPRAAQLFRLF